ncbi:S16 family serine protease [Ferdinandcohnia sp. Marseille-Q9671]
MKKVVISIGTTAILLYGIVWLLYYFNFINAFWLIGVLLVELLLLLVVIVIFRKLPGRLIQIITLLFICILMFEVRLLHYESQTYTVSLPSDPIEAVENSGIHLMVVKTFEIGYLTDGESIKESFKREGEQVLSLHKIDNRDRYFSKNIELLNWIMNKDDHFSIMKENVTNYLSGDTSSIDTVLERDDISGDSVGLGLALSAILAKGELQNKNDIGVTGALDQKGNVLPIGMVEEKVRIAEKNSFPYIIVPSGNAEEVLQVKNSSDLNIEIYDVSHIDQAISLIKTLNEKGKTED